MENKMNLIGDDLVKIIKACKTAKVSELKIGDIEIKFSESDKASFKPKSFENLPNDLESYSGLDESATEVEPPKNKEDDDENLLLMDPSEWEKQAMLSEV